MCESIENCTIVKNYKKVYLKKIYYNNILIYIFENINLVCLLLYLKYLPSFCLKPPLKRATRRCGSLFFDFFYTALHFASHA